MEAAYICPLTDLLWDVMSDKEFEDFHRALRSEHTKKAYKKILREMTKAITELSPSLASDLRNGLQRAISYFLVDLQPQLCKDFGFDRAEGMNMADKIYSSTLLAYTTMFDVDLEVPKEIIHKHTKALADELMEYIESNEEPCSWRRKND